jgi:aminoglycoside phosphotransferase (APT) family kinase protein
VLDLRAVDRIERATGGAATSVWRVEVGARRYALRVFQAHQRHVLDRELVAMAAARRGGVPVPRVHAVGTYDERPALLLEWCNGQPLVESLTRRPRNVFRLGVAFGEWHRSVHGVAAPTDLRGTWIDWPSAAEPSLAAQLRTLDLRVDRLLHLDFHLLNVLADDFTPTAILDWTNAHAGDPRADVARTATILRLMPRVLKQSATARLGSLLFELAWRRGYGAFGEDMAPFYAWAGGAMLSDLAGRFPPDALEPVQRWTRGWRQRSHLP